MSARSKHATIPINDVDSIYVSGKDRFVVSLIVGYSDEDLRLDGAAEHDGLDLRDKAAHAAAAALDLTRDEGCSDTKWFVYDRGTDTMHEFEQGEFEDGFR